MKSWTVSTTLLAGYAQLFGTPACAAPLIAAATTAPPRLGPMGRASFWRGAAQNMSVAARLPRPVLSPLAVAARTCLRRSPHVAVSARIVASAIAVLLNGIRFAGSWEQSALPVNGSGP